MAWTVGVSRTDKNWAIKISALALGAALAISVLGFKVAGASAASITVDNGNASVSGTFGANLINSNVLQGNSLWVAHDISTGGSIFAAGNVQSSGYQNASYIQTNGIWSSGTIATGAGLRVAGAITAASVAVTNTSVGTNVTIDGHLGSTQGTPPGCAASVTGLSACAVSGGTDTKGVITTTGTPSAVGTVTITSLGNYTTAPVVVISPANASAQAANAYVSSSSVSGFVITTTAATPGATPKWNYIVIQ